MDITGEEVKKTLAILFTLLAVITVTACGPSADTRYDNGYSDGYATGYNTTCKIRATLIEGDWDDKHYSRGYQDGYSSGSSACRNADR